jgi:hypothetical protein
LDLQIRTALAARGVRRSCLERRPQVQRVNAILRLGTAAVAGLDDTKMTKREVGGDHNAMTTSGSTTDVSIDAPPAGLAVQAMLD